MATVDLTNVQLDAAATAVKTIAQPAKTAAVYDAATVTFYKADSASGALSGKIVCSVDLGDGGSPTVIASDDATVLLAAETAGIVKVLKRLVVEARARKGAV